MGDLDGDAGGTEVIEQQRGVLHRHAEAGGERTRRNQRRGGQEIHRGGGAGMPPSAGHGAAGGAPGALQGDQQIEPVRRFVGQRAEERRHPGVALPRRVGAQRAVAGQRHRYPQQALRHPEPHQGRADRRAGAASRRRHRRAVATGLAVAAEPGVQAGGGGEQRGGAGRGGGREDLFGALHRALLVEIRCHQPLVQVERVAGGGEDGAAVDDAERAVHAEAKPFEHGGEVPGIDHKAVDRGLAAHGVEPGAVQEGRQKRMAGERLVEPGERRGGLRQGAGQRRIQVFFPGAGRSNASSIFSTPGGPAAAAGAALRRPRPAPPIHGESTACAPGYANRAIRCNSPVMCSDPPSRTFLCPISPLVGHSNLGHSGAA